MVSADFFPPDDLGFGSPSIPAEFSAVFALFAIVVLVGIGFSIYVGVRKYAILKQAGHDPLTVDAALAAKVLDSDLLRPGAAVDAGPARSLEERLSEVDTLHARGVISDDERAAARASILRG